MIKAHTGYYALKSCQGWVVSKQKVFNGQVHSNDIIATEKQISYLKVPLFTFMVPVSDLLPEGSKAIVQFYGKTIHCKCGDSHKTEELQYDSEGRMAICEMEMIKENLVEKTNDFADSLAYYLETLKNQNGMPIFKEGRFNPGEKPSFSYLRNGDSIFNRECKKILQPLQEHLDFINKMKTLFAKKNNVPLENVSFKQNGSELLFTIIKNKPATSTSPELDKVVKKALKKLAGLQAGNPLAGRIANAITKSYERGISGKKTS